MTAEPEAIHYRRLRAPSEDGGGLIDPPPAKVQKWLEQSALLITDGAAATVDSSRTLPTPRMDCQGQSLAELSRATRRRLLSLAIGYSSKYCDRDLPPIDALLAEPIIVAGHQPTLFHPGVWFKNFAASAFADRSGGTTVNLVVDNDTIRTAAIRVPTSNSGGTVRFENVPFDLASAEVPFEERRLLDAATFDSFGKRVADAFAPMAARSRLPRYTPLVAPLWQLAVDGRRQQSRDVPLGWLMAEARHRLEGSLGLSTLELPLSVMSDTDEFRTFAAFLLAELPRFRQVYNQSLAEYRAVNHIRSRSHPVPDLAAADGWLEAPLWMWSADNPRRRHLFARFVPGGMEISDREGFTAALDLNSDRPSDTAVEQLAALRDRGNKIRPRALITTMFSRLLFGDLFLHGIGGAKYDELTDAIIRRFWGLLPPPYVTLTATLLLPIERPAVTSGSIADQQRTLRETQYHAERFAAEVPAELQAAFGQHVATKRQLINDGWQAGKKGEWHQALDQVNSQLRTLIAPLRKQINQQQPAKNEKLLVAQRLASREFSFALFPEETLPQQLQSLCDAI